jgi:tRNA 2-thiocytidine biosynthesis protein TtcA
MLDDWERRAPGRRQKMFRALTQVRPSHLLDPELFDFAGLVPLSGHKGEGSAKIPQLR